MVTSWKKYLQPLVIKLPDNSAKYTYSITKNNNVLEHPILKSEKHYMYSRISFNLRNFFIIQVVAKQAEQIVLKKK